MIPFARSAALLAVLTACGTLIRCEQPRSWANALEQAGHIAPDARIVVLDLHDGRLVAARHFDAAARTLAAPGSTLKPIVLYLMLTEGLWAPEKRVSCQGLLVIAQHSLACSHPVSAPFDARAALAWSCNTYFAELARAIPPGKLKQILGTTGLLGQTGLARDEAIAGFRQPQTPDDAALAVLGVQGIQVTPLELASAYRWLALQMAAHPGTSAANTVQAGLMDSASFGIAAAAGSGGVPVIGKTGTAEGAGSKQTHGWFVGLAPASKPDVVIAVYVPVGHGADAARVAGKLLGSGPMVQK